LLIFVPKIHARITELVKTQIQATVVNVKSLTLVKIVQFFVGVLLVVRMHVKMAVDALLDLVYAQLGIMGQLVNVNNIIPCLKPIIIFLKLSF
jgi:hypothetical protein